VIIIELKGAMEPPVPNEQDQERLASFLNQNEEETNASNNSATPIVSNTTRPTSVNTSTVSTEATSNTDSHAPTALYDPYNPVAIRQSVRGSLLDDEESTVCTVTSNATATQHDEEDIGTQKHSIPGTANFLEMEQEPPRTPPSAVMVGRRRTAVSRPPPEPEAPIQTSSGLLLTHRRTPQGGGSVSSSSRNRTTANQRDETHNYYDDDDNQKQRRRSPSSALFAGPLANERFEVEDAHSAQYYRQEQESFLMHRQLSPLQQARRWLRYARAWVILCAIVLVLGMSIVLKHARHENSIEDGDVQVKNGNENYFVQDGGQQSDETNNIVRVVALDQVPEYSIPDKVVLLPLDTTTLSNQKNQQPNYHPNTGYNQQQQEQQQHSHHHGRMLSDLRDDFASWMQRHGKVYNSIEEQEKRYHIWVENHHRTRRKNEEHGPCKLTAQPVFGSNHLQDLTQEEFAQQYLNSAPKPQHDAKENKTKRRQDKRATKKEPGIMGSVETKRHPEVHRRIQELWGKDGTTSSTNAFKGHARQSNWKNCDWYDASCYLKYIMENYFYGLGRTMEPAYDADSYPNGKSSFYSLSIRMSGSDCYVSDNLFCLCYRCTAVDWRDVGAVTEVHSQGNCGACWAITAVETIESATFLASGELRDLSEAEVIVCAEDCEMCSGGWPQNAFDYVMELGGIPLESDMSYDGDYLLALTEALEGERNDVE